ncbi:TetR/AcrR family transcriptional regulator [Lysinibacter cavernae]|uniref:AcrR family transcriptional regulator n=1 Tax=Lysinibacter cavernae TaxID=1640652 RepID=A0A7X5TU14_9MICO|nr:hypothetical protein [Lysinibacter cavernae]NIH54099.1 AcrR family transcriptional regulator [Lysinibacter cavernae]
MTSGREDGDAKRVGRPRALSQQQVAEAIIQVGFRDLRATDVADALGVNPATLYRFVSGVDDMVALALGELIRAEPWPVAQDDWRDYLEQFTWAVWRLVYRHDGLATAATRVLLRCPEMMTLFSDAIAALVRLGFRVEDAAVAVDLTLDLAIDSVRMRELMKTLPESEDPAEPWSEGLDRSLLAVMRSAVRGEAADWFARKLEFALNGIPAPPELAS